MVKAMRSIFGSLAISGLVLSACGGDNKKSDSASDSLATAAMASPIQTVLNLGATISSTAVDLEACPLGDFDAMVAKAPTEISATADVDGELFAYVYQPDGADEPPHLQCGRGGLGAYTGLAPQADYKDELIRLLDDFVLTFDNDRAHRGGTIVRFCAEMIGAGDGDFCEADWYDDNVWVGVFIDGEARSAELAELWVVAILDDVVANVPLLAPGTQIAN